MYLGNLADFDINFGFNGNGNFLDFPFSVTEFSTENGTETENYGFSVFRDGIFNGKRNGNGKFESRTERKRNFLKFNGTETENFCFPSRFDALH